MHELSVSYSANLPPTAPRRPALTYYYYIIPIYKEKLKLLCNIVSRKILQHFPQVRKGKVIQLLETIVTSIQARSSQFFFHDLTLESEFNRTEVFLVPYFRIHNPDLSKI